MIKLVLGALAALVIGGAASTAVAQSSDNPYASPQTSTNYEWHKAQPAPTSAPAATTSEPANHDDQIPNFKWGDTNDFLVTTYAGADPNNGWRLRPAAPVSYAQSYVIEQIHESCKNDLSRINGQTMETLKSAVKVGGWETFGTIVGSFFGYNGILSSINILKQVVAPTAGAAFGGGIATGQIETAELMSMAMYVCVSEKVNMSRRYDKGDLGDIVIVPALRFHGKAAPRSQRGVSYNGPSEDTTSSPARTIPIG